jgi:hypothetical protein
MRKPIQSQGRAAEQGMALILAILALMLLTFLGLTLTMTTSTELQIATNYRWSQQALYNAEAGLEVAKRYLRNVVQWGAFLPPARSPIDPLGTPPVPAFCSDPNYTQPGPDGEASRTCELSVCDTQAAIGYGVVLWDKTFTNPFQNFPSFFLDAAAPGVGVVNGTFTVWARRPLEWIAGVYQERPTNDRVILTVEGTAPASGTSDFALTNRAVRMMEVTLERLEPGDCENRGGQIGGGPTGSGFDQCDTVKKEGILGGVGEPNPGQQ